ncbi:MAG: tRNA 5-methoxyuridine(34)/uridine 5-oxyacetic acid(34) synthase CmoB [Motiliproteus sp.]|nr:tRNA 5-methoxyuridine(34)/uridine 5-oxyacetic acid(34) synthase CmoB [Motiliproteus sp.]
MTALLDFFDNFFQELENDQLAPFAPVLRQRIEHKLRAVNHGDLPGWLYALDNLPDVKTEQIDLDRGCLQVGDPSQLSDSQQQQLESNLRALMPWRKGPYDLFGVHIDTEWRSDLKWDRVAPHISSLKNRLILDVGCGNGYHCWRMLEAGARQVIGIDPSWKFLIQFQALKKYIGQHPVELLPLGVEEMPAHMNVFDTVFSMGVFYHRRSPIDHLSELSSLLRPGGELVLETLVIDGDEHAVLMPEDRYAQMRNVWFLPSTAALQKWLQRVGFKEVRCVDVNQTSAEEQRSTDWMRFHSLPEFLDPANPELTIEGLPAPKRAVFVAQKSY